MCLSLIGTLLCLGLPGYGALSINEFMADNDETRADEDGDFSDWIEIQNDGLSPVEMLGWHLTDDAAVPTKWTFPSHSLAPGGRVLVFASGKARSVAGQELHSNFSLETNGEYLGLFAPGGAGPAESEFAPAYPEQRSDVSYGQGTVGSEGGVPGAALVYFQAPTPEDPNGSGVLGFVKDTKFSVPRGFKDTAFDVTVSSATAGATIAYTLDGSTPSPDNGVQVPAIDSETPPSVVLNVSTTTTLRAMAYLSNWQETNVDTLTYIFVDDVKNQGNTPPGYPTVWMNGGGTLPADYEMDPQGGKRCQSGMALT